MALLVNNNIAYDSTGHYYYLTVVGAELETGHALNNVWTNAQARLKKQGRDLMRWLGNNVYNGSHLPRSRPVDWLEYEIFINSNGEATHIYNMLIEMAEWAYETDGDKKQYEDNATSQDFVPIGVKHYAKSCGLKTNGDVRGAEIPVAEWRVGY